MSEGLLDKTCNLECIERLPPVYEFVGPVKIILVEIPKARYKRRVWYAAFIALANMFMGATSFTILCYSLSIKGTPHNILHVALCTIGYQLLIPSGILMMNFLHGPAAPQNPSGRKAEHVFLQMCGLACAVGGSIVILLLGNFMFTIHSCAGLTAGGLAVLGTLNGPLAYFSEETSTWGKVSRRAHIAFAIPSLIASSFCFSTGILKEPFVSWSPASEMVVMLIIFCSFYTLIIIYEPLKKLCNIHIENKY